MDGENGTAEMVPIGDSLSVPGHHRTGGEWLLADNVLPSTPTTPALPKDADESVTVKVLALLERAALRFVYLRHWVRGYTLRTFRLDVVAGLTVGVVVIPQSMAYATLAGLAPIAGLYSALTPLVVYGLLGSCGQLAIGPTAIHAIITSEYILGELGNQGADHMAVAGALAFYSGVLRVGLGLAGMGFLANFLSQSVISGFTSAAGIMIMLSQVRSLTGLPIQRGRTIFQTVYYTSIALPAVSWGTAASVGMGGAVIAFLLLLRRVPRLPKWFPLQLFALVICTLFCWGFRLNELVGIQVLGDIPAGFPPFTPPIIDEHTTVDLYFQPILVLTAIAFMESVSIGQKFSRERNYHIDPSQELLAMGLANALGSLLSSFPVTGSFSRSVISAHVGAVTPLANVAAALVVAAALSFMTPAFFYLPKTCLAGIIVSSAWTLVEFREVSWLWRHRLPDRIVWLSAFCATLSLGVGPGVIIGVAISFALLIHATATPNTCVLGRIQDDWRDIRRFPEARLVPRITVFRVDAQFSFTNAEYIRTKVEQTLKRWDDTRCFIIDCRAVNGSDATAVHMLEDLTTILLQRDQPVQLILAYVKLPLAIYIDKLYENPAMAKLKTFPDTRTAVEWSLDNMPHWPGDVEEEPIVDFCI